MAVMTQPSTSQYLNAIRSSEKSLLPNSAISFVDYKNLRFLIHDSPCDTNIGEYIKVYRKYNVTDVVRVCEATYSPVVLEKEGFKFHAWQFEDGGIPPDSTVSSWLKLVHERFYSGSSNNNSSSGSNPNSPPSQSSSETPPPLSAATTPTRPSAGNNGSGSGGEPTTIAVHCVAGLGRAPVLVAVALIEAGLSPLDAIELIRRRRRGAFNSRQIAYVDSYKKQSKASSLLKNTFSRMFRRSQA